MPAGPSPYLVNHARGEPDALYHAIIAERFVQAITTLP